ncbi:hypothetical protein Tco_0232970 [Tanacetum coccineum]
MAAPTIPVPAKENLGDPIYIRVDIIHLEPVAAVAFPAAAVMRIQAQQGEAIRGIQHYLLGVPIQEELTALRFRVDIAEAENASLRARIKTTKEIEKITRNRERQVRIKIEQQLAAVQESQRQDQEEFRKLKTLFPPRPRPPCETQWGKGNEQTLENPNRSTSDAALREYCDKNYDQLLPIIAKKVHKEKAQQDKLKEVKARLNFTGYSRKNSKIQEVSQHSESRTPDVRGDLRMRLRSRRSHNTSRSPEPTPSIFSRIRRDRSQSPRNGLGIKEERKEVCLKGWGIKKEVCPHIGRAATKVPVQEEQNRSTKSVTMRGHLHGERNHSQRVRIAEEDTGSQDRKNKIQALKKTTGLNHGCKGGTLGNANMVSHVVRIKSILSAIELLLLVMISTAGKG